MRVRRWWLFWVGLGFSVVCALFAFTPVVWILEGRSSESYPELFFAFIGLPMAGLVTLLGLARGLRSARAERMTKGISR